MVSIYPEHSQAAILDELGDQILIDPESYLRGERKYLSKNQFLSGDILNKIEVVQLLVEENNQEHDWNHALDLLESVRPPRIHLADIEFKIGSRWIPQSVYGKFAFECFTNREFELSSPDVESSLVLLVFLQTLQRWIDLLSGLQRVLPESFQVARQFAPGKGIDHAPNPNLEIQYLL